VKSLIIAVDGYASCGKSTLARDLAAALAYRYIDSGAMYRAVTWYLLQEQIQPSEHTALHQALNRLQIDFVRSEGRNDLLLNGRILESELRSKEVTQGVSQVAALPSVRLAMVARQREFDDGTGLSMDGRDIGTYVFPHADLKLFVFARPEIRAARRLAELKAQGDTKWTLEEVQANLAQRDHTDSTRDFAPLRRAEDALDLDNSLLNRRQQLEIALGWAKERGA
jgi:cytidylate kinase